MTAQPVQSLSVLAAAPVYNAPASTDTVAVGPAQKYILHIKNASGASVTVTVDDQTSVSPSQAVTFNPDVAVVVPAAGERILIIDSNRFRDITGKLNIAFSATASVTYAIYGPL